MGDWKKSEAQLRKTINDMNVVTGANDTNIVDGVDRLIEGYGKSSEPKLQDKVITENGTYQADSGFDGLGSVTVEVASSGGGNLQEKTFYSNGTYTPDDGFDGFSQITILAEGADGELPIAEEASF